MGATWELENTETCMLSKSIQTIIALVTALTVKIVQVGSWVLNKSLSKVTDVPCQAIHYLLTHPLSDNLDHAVSLTVQ